MNILHYSQITHLGKVSNFFEIWEEFPYLLVCVLFCHESLNFPLFIRKRFISKLFLEKFCKLCNYTFFRENFLLGKLAIHSVQLSSASRIIFFAPEAVFLFSPCGVSCGFLYLISNTHSTSGIQFINTIS